MKTIDNGLVSAMRVTGGARLTFSLIDLNGFSGRRYGSAALAIHDPSFTVTVLPLIGRQISVTCGNDEQRGALTQSLRVLQQRLNGPGALVTVHDGIPAHMGFGSKTLTVMAAARAYAALCPRQPATKELAVLTGRGGTGGASVSLSERGGFIIDGGHRNSPDFHRNPHAGLIDDVPNGVPPVISALPFPDWPILIIIPKGQGLHGEPEKKWFASTVPLDPQAATHMAHLVLMNLAPAIADSDYAGFCQAVNKITTEGAFKSAQIDIQSPQTHHVLAHAYEHGIDAIGMSSMGPACYAFSRDLDRATDWIRDLREQETVDTFFITHARNTPPTLERTDSTPISSGPSPA